MVGKHLEVPAYKLMGGQNVREAVKVAASMRPASPEHFRAEVQRAADQGYMVFKMHSCSYHDIIEQTRMAEEVAPEGFKIHWDQRYCLQPAQRPDHHTARSRDPR